MTDILFIDGSKWQGITTATQAAAFVVALKVAGCKGVIWKGYESAASPRHHPSYALMKAAVLSDGGMKWGAYCYLDPADGALQADGFISSIGIDGRTGLMLDWEAGSRAQALAFLDRIWTRLGVRCMVYTRASYVAAQGGTRATELSQYPLMAADYDAVLSSVPPWKTAAFWQKGSSIVGGRNVDHDYYQGGDLDALWDSITPLPVTAPGGKTVILDVPYYEQWGTGANKYRLDCGPACVKMVLDYMTDRGGYSASGVSIDQLATESEGSTDLGLFAYELVGLAARHGLSLSYDSGVSVNAIIEDIDRGLPSIALVSYGRISTRSDKAAVGGHFMVVVGYTPDSIIVDDPDWTALNGGKGLSIPRAEFISAMSAMTPTNQACSVLGYQPVTGVPSQPAPPTSTPGVGQTASVLISLNLRVAPGINSAKLATLAVGTGVQVTTAPVLVGDYWWVHITSGSAAGYVAVANGDGKTPYLKVSAAPVPVPPPVIVVPGASTGGYGPHFLGGQGAIPRGCPVYKSVDNVDALVQAHAENPAALCIFRSYQSGPQDSVDSWLAYHGGHFEAMPWAYFENLNEAGDSDDYLAFEAARTRKMGERSLRACVLNIAVGNSNPGTWQRGRDMVQAVLDNRGIVGVHAYWQTVVSNVDNGAGFDAGGNWHGDLFPARIDVANAWTGFRVLKDRRTLMAQGQGNVQIVASELGADDLSMVPNIFSGGPKVKGWRECWDIWARNAWTGPGKSPAQFYREQLNYWVSQTGCLGTVFTHGTGGDPNWAPFDTTSDLF